MESSNLVRDGDIISVDAKFKIQDKISSHPSEAHKNCTGYTSSANKTDTIAGNICNINTTEDDLPQLKQKIKHSKNKNTFGKGHIEQKEMAFCLENKDDSYITDFKEMGDLITEKNINPHQLSESITPELSALGNASKKNLSKIVENKNLINGGSFFVDDSKLCILNLKSETEKDQIKKEAHNSKDNQFNKDKNVSSCYSASIKRQKLKDTDSRSLSALIKNLQMEFSEDLIDDPKTKSSEDTLDASSLSKFKQDTVLGKRKRVRKRKKCQKNATFKESSNPIEKLDMSKSENLKTQNQHIRFNDNDSDEISTEKATAYKEQQSLSIDSRSSENKPTVEEKHLELKALNEVSSLSDNSVRDSVQFSTFVKKHSDDKSLQENVKNLTDYNIENKKFPLRYNAETLSKPGNAIHGFPIDPFNKFNELLMQRNFSGRQVEIISSGDGHHVYHSHRKRKKDFLTSFSDSCSDLLVNVSTVVLSTENELLRTQGKASKNNTLIDADNSSQTLEIENDSKIPDYKNLDILHRTPQAGDVIAFKIIELSDNYSPTLSNFKEAKVISVNKDFGSICLELTKALKKRTLGKFDLDHTGYDADSNRLETYSISELMEVRLVQTVEKNLVGVS
ncbi:hypothetical protein Btru_005328 [Bulinus truncatus]|nr:hypothetical protein Btru_005328 [Bulinus truncatus]